MSCAEGFAFESEDATTEVAAVTREGPTSGPNKSANGSKDGAVVKSLDDESRSLGFEGAIRSLDAAAINSGRSEDANAARLMSIKAWPATSSVVLASWSISRVASAKRSGASSERKGDGL